MADIEFNFENIPMLETVDTEVLECNFIPMLTEEI